MRATEINGNTATRGLGFTTLDEELCVERLPVQGEIPGWLQGTLMRATPALFDVGGRPAGHWFDGLAMLNAFTFDAGRVGYANRFVDTPDLREARQGRWSQAAYIGTDPCRKLGSRLMSVFDHKAVHTPNVSIIKLGERYLTATEAPCPVEFDPKTLQTLGHVDISTGPMEVHGPLAHMHADRATGGAIGLLTHVGLRGNEHRIFALAPDTMKRTPIATLPAARNPHYMHSFAMSERHFVIVESPMTYSLVDLARHARFDKAFRWDHDAPTRLRVIDRTAGRQVAVHEVEPFFCWHQINAFDDGDDIVVDLVAWKDPTPFWQVGVANLRDPGHHVRFCGTARRLRLPGENGAVQITPLADACIEFPQINYGLCNERPYRHAWAIGYRGADSDWFDQIVKIDVESGEVRTFHEPDCYPGEPTIVPRPGARSEDDALLLNIVLDANAGRSHLLILDAATMQEIGRAQVPHHLPFNFHQRYLN